MRAAAFAALALAGGAAALPVGAPAPAPAADEPKRELQVVVTSLTSLSGSAMTTSSITTPMPTT